MIQKILNVLHVVGLMWERHDFYKPIINFRSGYIAIVIEPGHVTIINEPIHGTVRHLSNYR